MPDPQANYLLVSEVINNDRQKSLLSNYLTTTVCLRWLQGENFQLQRRRVTLQIVLKCMLRAHYFCVKTSGSSKLVASWGGLLLKRHAAFEI